MVTATDRAYIAEVPSNIALVKYWGKRDGGAQWPANDSLSMTLSASRSRTAAMRLGSTTGGGGDLVRLDGRLLRVGERRAGKALGHLAQLRSLLGFEAPLAIDTRNTFPSDCGIASSASGLGALTIAAIAAWTGAEDLEALDRHGFTRARLAALARLGSGSACRSLYGGFVRWGAGEAPDAQTVERLDVDWPLANVIVIISDAAKPVSSTVAHAAAWTSPLFLPRLAGLPERLRRVEAALRAKDLEALGDQLEAEALEMHAVMLSSAPSACYVGPETSRFLAWVRDRRAAGELPAWFTLDAGPNPHLICAPEAAEKVARCVSRHFDGYRLIIDGTGGGPTLTTGAPEALAGATAEWPPH
jgi:diphosphomevalonate decarboxylase